MLVKTVGRARSLRPETQNMAVCRMRHSGQTKVLGDRVPLVNILAYLDAFLSCHSTRLDSFTTK